MVVILVRVDYVLSALLLWVWCDCLLCCWLISWLNVLIVLCVACCVINSVV